MKIHLSSPEMKIPPVERNEFHGTASLLSSKEAIKKKSHTSSQPRRCRGGINGGTYTIVSRLNRGTRRKRKKKEDSTERDGRNFLISSQDRAGWLEIKKGQVIRRGMVASLYYSTPITTTLRFSCYLSPPI